MTTPDAPLDPELVDELLSADLDGELVRAATDLGLDVETARATIATPSARARRAELTNARELLGVAPARDAAREQHLVAQALAATDARSVVPMRPRRSAQVWRVVAGIAATAAVVAGVVAIANQGTQSQSKSSSASLPEVGAGADAGTPNAAKAPGAVVDFGDVSHERALRTAAQNALQRRLRGTDDLANGYVAAPPAQASFGEASKSSTSRAEAADTQRAASRASCVASVRRTLRLGPPLLSGVGTSDGRRVFVIVFATAGGSRVYVVSATDCSVVTSVPVA